MKPHKNAPHVHAELIKAWADGAEIEWRGKHNGEWDDWRPVSDNPAWMTDPTYEYRIKPEPKPDVVAVGIIEWDGHLINCAAQYNTAFRVSERYERNNLRLTFDGETGKLKSAEVLR